MPLDEDIKGGHGEGEAGVEVLPAPMHHLLEVADHGQHGEHRLHQHAVLPLPALTEFEVGGVALGGMETGVAQDNHAPVDLSNQPLKCLVWYIRRWHNPTLPPGHTGSTTDRVSRRQSSDGWTGLC